jgi:hypothetical protein
VPQVFFQVFNNINGAPWNGIAITSVVFSVLVVMVHTVKVVYYWLYKGVGFGEIPLGYGYARRKLASSVSSV